MVVLYFLGKRTEKKQAEQKEQLDAVAQTVNMLIIDKKNDRSYVYKKENIKKIIYAWQNTKTVLQWSITHKKGVAYDF